MTIYAAVLETEGFTVGQDNSRSGLFRQETDGTWTSLGWVNIRNFGIAISPDYIFLASGNGVLRSGDDGANWRLTTDWTITEVLDIALDPGDPHRLVIATAHGIHWSPDDGDSWRTNNEGLASRFVQSVVVESGVREPAPSLPRGPESGVATSQSRWIVGTDEGLFAAAKPDAEWTRAGLDGLSVRRIAMGRDGVCVVATDGNGVWIHGANAWIQPHGLPPDASFYAAAVSDDGQSIATGGYQSGVYLSRDGGGSWSHLTEGLRNLNIQALSFRPESEELWVGTSGGGVYRLDGNSWVSEGLPGSTIRKIYFDTTR